MDFRYTEDMTCIYNFFFHCFLQTANCTSESFFQVFKPSLRLPGEEPRWAVYPGKKQNPHQHNDITISIFQGRSQVCSEGKIFFPLTISELKHTCKRWLNLFTVAVPSRPEYPASCTGMCSNIQRPQHRTIQVRKVHRITGYGHIPFQQCPILFCPEWSHCWYLW